MSRRVNSRSGLAGTTGMPLAHAAFIGFALAGCGLPLTAEETPNQNVCTSDSDCGDGLCATVEDTNRCVATDTDLAGIVLQLEGTTADGTSISHVFAEGLTLQGVREGGAVVGRDLEVPLPLTLSGRFVHPSPGEPGACTASDGTVPVKVEARSANPLVGLEQVFTGASTVVADATGATSHTFALGVPPGTYDVYVAPLATEDCTPLPPRIFPAVKVETHVKLEPGAEPPRRLTGVVIPGGGLALENFRVELLEPRRGLPVSEAAPLAAPVEGGSPLLGGPDGTDEDGIAYYYTEGLVLRLSDAEGRLVVHWKFAALDFDGDDEVEIDLGDLIASQDVFRATVLDQDKRPVPAASVTIKSLSLTGDAGKNSSFRVTAQSDAAGVIEVALVPGTYQCLVVPPSGEVPGDEGPAQLEDQWQIQEDSLCCGKTFELPARPLLTGSVRSPSGDVVPSVPVLATPTLPGVRDYFARALESLDLLPRQAATTTDPSGLFGMRVDPGTYDLAIRAPLGTGFPWLVLPATVVAPLEQQPGAPIGVLTLPSPAIVIGHARLQTAVGREVAAGAIVRAYLPLVDDDPGTPTRVVAIGEVVTDDDGRFELPLPPTIARAVRGPAADPTDPSGATSAGGGAR